MENSLNAYDKAIVNLKKKLEGENSASERLELLVELGEYLRLIRPQEALEYGKKALEEAIRLDDIQAIGVTRLILAYVYCTISEFDLSKKYLKLNEESFKETAPHSEIMFRTYMGLGRLLDVLCHYAEGRVYYLECLTIAKKMKNISFYLKACTQIAKSYYKLGSYSEARFYIQKGLQMDNGRETDGLAWLYNMMGILYANQNAPDKAKLYYTKALKIWEHLGFYFRASYVHNNLGCVYINTGDLPNALSSFEEALILFEEMGSNINIGLTYHNIGDVYLEQGVYEKSATYQEKAMEFARSGQDKFGTIQAIQGFVMANFEMGKDLDKNLKLLKDAEDLAIEIGAKVQLREIYRDYLLIYEKQGNYKSAIEIQDKYLAIKEEIRKETIHEIERKYEFVLKEKELNLLNQQQDFLTKHNQELQVFAKKASDNLKTDIATINLYSTLIKQATEMDNKEMSLAQLSVIESSAGSIFDKITNLTRYTIAGVEKYDQEEIDLNDLFFIAKNTLKKELQEANAKWTIKKELPTIRTGYNGLLQVIQIIVGNAIKFREAERPLEIEIDFRENEAFVYVSIADNGIGIHEDDLDRVFNIFEGVNVNDVSSGNGIGLATGKRIINQLGGDIQVDSELGKGSTFSFALPKEPL